MRSGFSLNKLYVRSSRALALRMYTAGFYSHIPSLYPDEDDRLGVGIVASNNNLYTKGIGHSSRLVYTVPCRVAFEPQDSFVSHSKETLRN